MINILWWFCLCRDTLAEGYKVGICCCRTWQQHGSHKAGVQVPFRSQLQCYHQQLSCNIKCQDNRSLHRRGLKMTAAFFHLKGENCGVSTHIHTHTGPHWRALYTIWLVNFYKSSSARQEKTRPVAILSTTLQPCFRSHLNATCTVCVCGPTGAEKLRKKKKEMSWNSSFLRLLTCRCSWNRIGSIWAISAGFLCLKNPRGRKGEGDSRRNRGDLALFVP